MSTTSDDDIRKLWREAGGAFHGPKVETGYMTEARLLEFLRGLIGKTILAEAQAAGAMSMLAEVRDECVELRKEVLAAQGQADENYQRLQAAEAFDAIRFRMLAAELRDGEPIIHVFDQCVAAELASRSPPSSPTLGYQDRVAAACAVAFDGDPTDVAERRDRFAEEALEVVQAFGMTREEMHALVDYTFGRPIGDAANEIGASLLTLASLCVYSGHDLMACAEADLAKFQQPETIARIRAKRATRHGRGPLPGLDPNIADLAHDLSPEVEVMPLAFGKSREWFERKAQEESDADPTTGVPAPIERPWLKLAGQAIRALTLAVEDRTAGDTVEMNIGDLSVVLGLLVGKPCDWKWAEGQRVRKVRGSSWQGRVVGFYSTRLSARGYCVESEREPGSVQLYPEAALELVPEASP